MSIARVLIAVTAGTVSLAACVQAKHAGPDRTVRASVTDCTDLKPADASSEPNATGTMYAPRDASAESGESPARTAGADGGAPPARTAGADGGAPQNILRDMCWAVGCGPPASISLDLPISTEDALKSRVTFCRNADCVLARTNARDPSGRTLVGRSDAGPGSTAGLEVVLRANDPQPLDTWDAGAGTVRTNAVGCGVHASYWGDDIRDGDVYTLRVEGPRPGSRIYTVRQTAIYRTTVRQTGPGPNCSLTCRSMAP